VLFLRPYTLKRNTVKSERPKERDIESGEALKTEKIVNTEPSQLEVAPAPGDDEAAAEVSRRSVSKTDGGDDAGTIAGEPEAKK
jgi:hypothetical protein